LISLSPDGSKVFFCISNTATPNPARIHNVGTQALIAQFSNLPSSTGSMVCAAWSPDASYVAVGNSDGSVVLWDATNGNYVRSYFTDSGAQVQSVCFSSDGSLLMAGSSIGVTRVFVTATGEVLRQFAPTGVTSTNGVQSLAFLNGGTRIAAGHGDGRTF